jgi:protein gp37
MAMWNLWHGCRKISPGCQNCYVYRGDSKFGRDSYEVRKTQNFTLPVQKNRQGLYKLLPGETVHTCFTSDFFFEDADPWRQEAWHMIRARPDLMFLIITKRISRFSGSLPEDWGSGYDNVILYTTVENQAMADARLPLLLAAPLRHKGIVCEPLLGPIDLSPYLVPEIEGVLVGGESGPASRICDYNWVLDIRRQCVAANIPFTFRQTGRLFMKDGKLYTVERRFQYSQATKAAINTGRASASESAEAPGPQLSPGSPRSGGFSETPKTYSENN